MLFLDVNRQSVIALRKSHTPKHHDMTNVESPENFARNWFS